MAAVVVAALHVVDCLSGPGSKVGFPERMKWLFKKCIGCADTDYGFRCDSHYSVIVVVRSNKVSTHASC